MELQKDINVGDSAPDFKLTKMGGGEVSLSEYKGKQNVVVAFYPLDWTPG